MPNLLDSLIQLLQLLDQAELGWLANSLLVIVSILSVVYFLAFVLFSPKVIKLGKFISSGFLVTKSKIDGALSSPYDVKFFESKVILSISLLMYYMCMVLMVFCTVLFLGKAFGFLFEEKLPMSKSFLVYIFSIALFLLACFFKCQGDKDLYKLRSLKNT